MLWNILEIESVHIDIYLPAAAKLCYIKHSPLLTSNLLHCLHQMFFIIYIKSSPLFSTSDLLHFLHQMVLKLFFRCSHNISFPDPEGADQPEERYKVFDERYYDGQINLQR